MLDKGGRVQITGRLEEIGEFGLIERVRERHSSAALPVHMGIGDDCAVFSQPPGTVGLITTDTLVEETHFRLKWTDLFTLGRKSLNVNVSDIAAMGGMPLFYTLALGLPRSLLPEEIEAFYAGLDSAASECGVQLVGGDTCYSRLMSITVTLVGSAGEGELLLRRGARPGDLLAVSGVPGLSAVGLEILEQGLSPGDAPAAVRAHLDPLPRVELGRALARLKIATAAIDTSDGLAWDCEKIAVESGVAIVLEEESLPLPPVPKGLQHSPLFYALHGGEDYQLLFTLSPLRVPHLSVVEKELGEQITIIGRVEEGEGVFVDGREGRRRLRPEGFRHF